MPVLEEAGNVISDVDVHRTKLSAVKRNCAAFLQEEGLNLAHVLIVSEGGNSNE